MANNFVFSEWVSMEALRLLVNMIEVAQFFNKDYEDDYEREFPVGETVTVKLPQRWTIRNGLQYTPQAINRITTTITLNQIMGIDFEWDSVEKALKMERKPEEISDQYIKPAMAQIAQEIDSRCALFAYQNANNIVGVLGTDPTTTTVFQQARQRMKELACPPTGDKGMLIPPQFNTSLVPQLQSLFNPSSDISKQYREGSIGKLSGFDWYESMSLWRHTAGTQTTWTVNGGGQSGASLAVSGTAGDTGVVGDVFNIISVNQTNPMTRRTLAVTLKQFVIISPITLVGGGNAADVLSISPAIFGPGSQYQNVDALPGNGATITLFPGTASPNGLSGAQALALHPEAFALVGVKLETPKAVEIASQTRDPDTGLAVRLVRAFDAVQSKMINRWDVCFGFGPLYPDNCAVRILGA